MKLIATHNSCTGLPSKNLLHKFIKPFAMCQSTDIASQYAAGCTYFDIRVRELDHQGEYKVCHGLWESKWTLREVLNELSLLSFDDYKPRVDIIYEGAFTCEEHQDVFMEDIMRYKNEYPQIAFVVIGVKKPTFTAIKKFRWIKVVESLYDINLRNFRWLIPIPWFWAFIRKYPDFNNEYYKRVDFL